MVASVPHAPIVSETARPEVAARTMTGPTGNDERLGTLDFLRGWALFGILFMNITGFGLSHAYYNPTNNGGSTGADLWAWLLVQVGLEGTQRGIFSILFGAGIVLFMRRAEKVDPAGAADIFVRRNLLLVGMGLINAWLLLWTGDILYFYGIIALFCFVFRKLPPRLLIALGVLSLLFSAAWAVQESRDALVAHDAARAAQQVAAKGGALSAEQETAIDAWTEMVAEHSPPRSVIAADIAAHRSGWFETLGAVAPDIIHEQSYSLYRYFTDMFGMMLIGMALFKLGVLTLERKASLYWGMMLCGYAVGLTVNIAEGRWMMQHGFSMLSYMQTEVTYDLGRIAMTAGHLGALLLLYRSGAFPWLRHSVSAVGQMALSNYLSHSLICLILFTGFGLYGQLARHQLYYVVVAICAVQLVVSPLWLRHYRFGPVEWAWRALTYGRKPAFRKPAAG
jgi:uncharacterized protein